MSLSLVGAAFFLPEPGDWNWAGTSRSGLGHHRIISLSFHLSIFPLLGMVFNPHSNLLLSHPPSPIPHRPRPRPQSPAPKLRHFCFQDGDPQPSTTTTPLIHRRFHPLRLADSWRPALFELWTFGPPQPSVPAPGFLPWLPRRPLPVSGFARGHAGRRGNARSLPRRRHPTSLSRVTA